MPKPYDATAKALIEAEPEAWIFFAGIPTDGPVRIITADLSTVTSAADTAIRVEGPTPWIAHIEFVSGHENRLLRDVALRNVLFHHKENASVRSILILLQPDAFRGSMTGVYETVAAGKRGFVLEYDIVKVWTLCVEELITAAASIKPLAVLSHEIRSRDDVPPVLDRLHDELVAELDEQPTQIKELWTAAEILLGLKFKGEANRVWIKTLTRGVLSVKDSIIYQDIKDEGRIEGREEALLMLGKKRWGQPSAGEKVALEAIDDIDRLNRMLDQFDNAKSWTDLLRIQ